MLLGDQPEGAHRTVLELHISTRRELNVGTRFCMM